MSRPASYASVIIDGQRYPLPERVVENIEAVIGFQTHQARTRPWHERLLAKIAATFGRPLFLYFLLVLFLLWWISSRLVAAHLLNLPIPLLDLQEQGIDVASLLIATGVLVRQTQQDHIAEQRSHLMLQINLLNEQKIAKVIGLLEELREDLPDVKNRQDWEANVLKKATDPQVVLSILQENLAHSSLEPTSEPPASDSFDAGSAKQASAKQASAK